jgi:hypothetical protein
MIATTLPLGRTRLQEGFGALHRDLIHEEGPKISTMRNYRFAILQYDPQEELKVRSETQKLSTALVANGWVVLSLSLQKLVLERLRAEGEEWVERVSNMEASLPAERAIGYLKDKITPLLEGPDGIAAECSRRIQAFLDENPDQADRAVVLIGRAGVLYPFMRSSALLKHLDGKTRNVPVILLYPGARAGNQNGLSFMGVLEPDSDYRPRIYP